jgi:hypothetical protein
MAGLVSAISVSRQLHALKADGRVEPGYGGKRTHISLSLLRRQLGNLPFAIGQPAPIHDVMIKCIAEFFIPNRIVEYTARHAMRLEAADPANYTGVMGVRVLPLHDGILRCELQNVLRRFAQAFDVFMVQAGPSDIEQWQR